MLTGGLCVLEYEKMSFQLLQTTENSLHSLNADWTSDSRLPLTGNYLRRYYPTPLSILSANLHSRISPGRVLSFAKLHTIHSWRPLCSAGESNSLKPVKHTLRYLKLFSGWSKSTWVDWRLCGAMREHASTSVSRSNQPFPIFKLSA